jgi:hypothetical protein
MAKRVPGLFDIDERLAELSAKGNDLEPVKALADFERFRARNSAPEYNSNIHGGGQGDMTGRMCVHSGCKVCSFRERIFLEEANH